MGMLEGRVALCAGAGRGVGAEVAKLMAAHGAKVVVNDPGTSGSGKSHLPAMYPWREYVETGGLMAYETEPRELGRRLADDVHEILNGAKPGDIPIYQPTKFEFLINLKTAKVLGLTIPPALLALADEVIE